MDRQFSFDVYDCHDHIGSVTKSDGSSKEKSNLFEKMYDCPGDIWLALDKVRILKPITMRVNFIFYHIELKSLTRNLKIYTKENSDKCRPSIIIEDHLIILRSAFFQKQKSDEHGHCRKHEVPKTRRWYVSGNGHDLFLCFIWSGIRHLMKTPLS